VVPEPVEGVKQKKTTSFEMVFTILICLPKQGHRL